MSPAHVQSFDDDAGGDSAASRPHCDPESLHYADERADDPNNDDESGSGADAEERSAPNEHEIQHELSKQGTARDIAARLRGRRRRRRRFCCVAIASAVVLGGVAAGIVVGASKRHASTTANFSKPSSDSAAAASDDEPPSSIYDMCLISAESAYASHNNMICRQGQDEDKYEDGIFSYGTTGAQTEAGYGGRWAQLADAILGEAGGDNSGLAVDMSCDGSIVAVGALMNDAADAAATPNIGHVRIFELTETEEDDGVLIWTQLGQDIDGAAAQDKFGGSLSLSADGKRIAIGAIGHDASDETTSTGRVQVYDFRMANWVKLTDDIVGTENSQFLGRAVSISADGMRLAVGSSGADLSTDDVGMVQVFELDENNTWQTVGETIFGEHGSSSYFGRSVSLSGDGTTLAVGGYGGDNGDVEDAGVVQIYKWKSELKTWAQQGRDLFGKDQGDWFGLSVALNYDGTRVVVGAPGDNSILHLLPGYAMVFEQSTSNEWEQLGQDLEGGYSVSISYDGSRVAAGSYKHYEDGINRGGVIAYEYTGLNGSLPIWITMGQRINGEARSMAGSSVSMSSNGMRITSGAPASVGEAGKLQSGSTQVFGFCGI